jgi:DMSO/TMAO reductase YedYZ molybdopterin-dependent catalytic subunit
LGSSVSLTGSQTPSSTANGAPLTYGHGTPLRLRNEIQLGFKQVKWLAGIDFAASFSEIGGGHGGCNPTMSSSATDNRSSLSLGGSRERTATPLRGRQLPETKGLSVEAVSVLERQAVRNRRRPSGARIPRIRRKIYGRGVTRSGRRGVRPRLRSQSHGTTTRNRPELTESGNRKNAS